MLRDRRVVRHKLVEASVNGRVDAKAISKGIYGGSRWGCGLYFFFRHKIYLGCAGPSWGGHIF